MATNMAPHNLVEVVQALRHLVTHPDATSTTSCASCPAPTCRPAARSSGSTASATPTRPAGARFRMRATARVETRPPPQGHRRHRAAVRRRPEKVIERIKELVQGKKLQGIADVKDLTDREHGLRLVIEVKNGFVPEAVLEQLYKLTPMEESFGINTVALVDGQPRTLGLKELLEVFLGHRSTWCAAARSTAATRPPTGCTWSRGCWSRILDIDEVIQLIRTSDDTATPARG